MKDYAELVVSLRTSSQSQFGFGGCQGCDDSEREDAADAIAALVAERDALKRRGDNHAETLRGIAAMDPATEADRMVLWARDGLSGYAAPVGESLKESSDRANAAEAERDALRKAAEAVDALWTEDALNYEDEMAIDSPVGKAWALVRAALKSCS